MKGAHKPMRTSKRIANGAPTTSVASGEMERPCTPVNRIIDPEQLQNLLRSPIRSPNPSGEDVDGGVDGLACTTAFSTPGILRGLNTSTYSSHNETEVMVTSMLEKLNQEPSTKLDNHEVRALLQKCLVTMSHYKLQNNILRFEAEEKEKRNAIETDLIKTQMDLLLKSPFKPSTGSSVVKSAQCTAVHKTVTKIPRIAQPKPSSPRVGRIVKPKLRLVERIGKREDQFGNCVKVFHLQKK
ncbi:unnamed protein product [Cyberlindnera jadinii]|uniref:Uncharacterized protein n=1 Tax=Cyberlindnera jadinii (strain ATCC 18201 / CBS 1600 / BCRC 20928 / JCM 3617 / NBRC 0987 / NRRL Y-1542) TaxID=983966 RepID=A0A0H5C579_CYBJN|nr:unnamed protein product [Cyberlindnera jadinii]